MDVVGRRTRDQMARIVVQGHAAGLNARRERDLLSEKLLLHIDGSGDFQWADILFGRRVEIPRIVSEFRKTENLLRIIVDNAVAHHTTMPLRYFADALPDRRARERSMLDALWMNQLADQQDLNALFAEALYMAMPAGFCPVHRYWSEDPQDEYEPIVYGSDQVAGSIGGAPSLRPGRLDCWVGNPFDTVFDRGAKRGSVRWCSYGRVVPAQAVRVAFAHVGPEVAALQGTNRIPSAAEFQRIARNWNTQGLGVHGSPITYYRRGEEAEEELMVLICRETAPGVVAEWPEGRLQIVAVPGQTDLLRGQNATGHAVLLADQPLPASDFSWTLFYSHHRGSDIHGKPWVEDIDQLQVDLNLGLSKRWEFLNRGIEAPIVAPGGAISDDMADINGYSIMEIDPSLAGWRPRTMEWPQYILTGLDREIADKRQAIYTIGGYQAASRGEAPGSRIAYRAVVALQQADNSIHGPVNMRFRRAACDFAVGCWKQFKTYGDVPWMLKATGDEYAFLAQPYVDNTRLSDEPPNYKLVNAFGPSPELRAQEVLELMQARGADGQPFLTTDEARKNYPNHQIFDAAGDPKTVQRRRAKTIAAQIHVIAGQARQQMGMGDATLQDSPTDPTIQRAAMQVFGLIEAKYPRLRDDDLMSHLASLSEITQDETADTVARLAAARRQDLYFQWQQQMASIPQPKQPDPIKGIIQIKGADMTADQLAQYLEEEGAVQAQPGGPGGPGGAPAPGAPAGPQAGPPSSPIDRAAIAAHLLSGGLRRPAPSIAATAR